MKHKFSSIDKLIKSNFKVFECPLTDKLLAENGDTDLVIFVKNNVGEFFYIDSPLPHPSTNLSVHSLPLKKTASICKNEEISKLIALLSEYGLLVLLNESGEPIGYLHFSSVLKELYDSYQYLEAYFDTILDTIDTSVCVIDEQETVEIWTKEAEKIFSISHQEIIGKKIIDYFDVNNLEMLKTLKNGKPFYRHQHQPRSDLFVLVNNNPIRLKQKIIGVVSVDTDITSQIRLNQELFNSIRKVQHLEQEVTKLKPANDPFQGIKGSSQEIARTIEMSKKAAATNATILILGESGVGKELIAKAIHDSRESAGAPYIPINCGAIPPSLFESELFGYEKGAFSGAINTGKKGKLELAQGGTLFLDEIGDMPLDLQVKLLRVLQDKRFYPVGGTKQIEADFRVIAATNRELIDLVKQGKFREDLYYRLNVITIKVPPLRERKNDVIELVHHFLYEFSIRYNKPIQVISQKLIQDFLHNDWPGNIRELRNSIERLVVFSTDEMISTNEHVHLSDDSGPSIVTDNSTFTDTLSTLQDELEKYEHKVICQMLLNENGNRLSTAKRLGISRTTLYNRMKKLGIM
ncbi:sigma-54-dependent Fis family transcriptional regulator [Brevibacillus reuszeri]|uniref:Histidine kinase n=1 Tax=Brevibacillus reuszeri TaxID=54915 RepID=A0A0K9YQ95_9BACL|nr:sigma-54-dependent Fis family transcriptional regulator [Brevibacillus reuszeri]KNB70340.1 histidine kinase [Brevibacillus reuszeri]MED1859306.1 sigma-54-dependent Fis family transcriptional regulator [Brevibacillus reuszeri]GED72626.1 sigma-54-dependent Fis family transcriptional regulator [Brevibacillus reuszeri]